MNAESVNILSDPITTKDVIDHGQRQPSVTNDLQGTQPADLKTKSCTSETQELSQTSRKKTNTEVICDAL